MLQSVNGTSKCLTELDYASSVFESLCSFYNHSCKSRAKTTRFPPHTLTKLAAGIALCSLTITAKVDQRFERARRHGQLNGVTTCCSEKEKGNQDDKKQDKSLIIKDKNQLNVLNDDSFKNPG